MAIPETILKKRRLALRSLRQDAAALEAMEKRKAVVRDRALKSAKAYAAEYKQMEETEEQARQRARSAGNFYVPGEPKILLVIRIKGIVGVSPKVRSILNLFRLRQINNAVFLRCNKATLNALRIVEPYVTYGEPSLETVRNLLYKRGFAKLNGQRIPIDDNTLIDENLRDSDIMCMEDLVHEIFTCGAHFKEANNFLWPFKLNSPTLASKRRNFADGGDFGFRGKYINDFVRKMI